MSITTTEAYAWRRLSIRAVYLELLQIAGSLVPGYLGVTLRDDGPIWFLVAGSCAGLLGAASGLVRWMTTRYRVTPDVVEMRSGLVQRKHRTVGRDRIRTVDSTARLLHRLLGLRVVRVGSADADAPFELNALDHREADQLHRDLMPGAPMQPAPDAEPAEQDEPAEQAETVIARWDTRWIPLNAMSIWAVFTTAGLLFALYGTLRPFGVDLLEVGRDLADRQPLPTAAAIAVCLLVAYPLGVLANAVTFVLQNAKFELVRTGTAPKTALVTRRGLLTTQHLQREDRRLRGLQFTEPLLWRWLGVTQTKVITTGLRPTGEAGTGAVLPDVRKPEARTVAARILPDGHRPLESVLRRHPRGALVRRIGWALWIPAAVSAFLGMFVISGALPRWVWPLPLLLVPVTVPLAVVAYRSLGHALTGPYLVVRRGAVQRHTVALQRRAVIGWTLRQSVFQRRGGRMTIGIATAAGTRYYQAPDAGVDQAIAFVRDATPDLAAEFLVPPVGARVTTRGLEAGSAEQRDDRGRPDAPGGPAR